MIVLEPITTKNAVRFKAVRLRALLDSPTAFGSTYAGEVQVSDAEWVSRAAECSREECTGYLAMEGQTTCGIVRATPDDQDVRVAWVESMWVAPAFRRLGVGRLLVEKILGWAYGRGLVALKLSVTSSNEPALRFYESFGFSPTGKTEPYLHDPALVECEMWLPLS